MDPRVSGLISSTKLQTNLSWWKAPQNFASKKVLRWIEYGVKVEFQKGLPFTPKPSTPKFVDPEDVDFAIQDLLKDRQIGVYQDLAPGDEHFLSRSRVHTPQVKGNHRIVHALCSLNETTVNRKTIYQDLRMLKSVVTHWWEWWTSPTHICLHCVSFHRPMSALGHSKDPSSSSHGMHTLLYVDDLLIV